MFVVFGRSRVKAEEKAIKNIGAVVMSLDEYAGVLDKKTKEIFERMRPVRCSQIYPTLSLAQEYIAMATEFGTLADPIIKKAVDGGENEKTGKKIIKWVEI